MSKNRFIVVLFALITVGSLGLAAAASACTEQCQKVGPGFCRQCVDTGAYTGGTCQSSGSCGCFYIPNTCGQFAATATGAKADFLIVENATPAQAPNAVEIDLVLKGQ